MENENFFEKQGFVLVKNFINEEHIEIISRYFENKINRGELLQKNIEEDDVVKGNKTTINYYSDPLLEVFLLGTKHIVEEYTSKKLHPTYSYFRLYLPGECLIPHKDRPSCEISVTVNVSFKGESSHFWLQYKDKPIEKFSFEIGDAIIYKGCEVLHWRETLQENQMVVQFMLHYVEVDGKYEDYKYDKRIGLGYNALQKEH